MSLTPYPNDASNNRNLGAPIYIIFKAEWEATPPWFMSACPLAIIRQNHRNSLTRSTEYLTHLSECPVRIVKRRALCLVMCMRAKSQRGYPRNTILALSIGLEPITLRLTAECSAIELRKHMVLDIRLEQMTC